MVSAADFQKELDLYLRARFGLIVLTTGEEERAIELLRLACAGTKRVLLTWDIADGFVGPGAPPNVKDPMTALDQIEKFDNESVVVLKDFHDLWGNPGVKRKLRSVAQRLKFQRKAIVVITPSRSLPDELRDEAVLVDLPNPDAPELDEVLSGLVNGPGIKVTLTPLGREKITQAAVGLTASQARRVFGKAIVADGVLDDQDIGLVTDEKKQIIRESEALEFYPVSETPDDVGGLDILKEWLRLRERAFTKEAADYGLPTPRGMALIGIPGTGKSLTAKMIGSLWRMPVIRLDVGALFGSLVGESEERARRALRMCETVAPCVVWIDEIEKGLAQGGLDGGTSTRVFGTILTWMQEKRSPCFVVATANDVAAVPPELLRKGRFDEVFFLDLPTERERREILEVHVRKRRRIPADFDLDSLAVQSVGRTGAELEQAIIDAMYVGFAGQREFATEDILAALQKQVPLSVSQREVITSLRNWLREGRAQSASFMEAKEAEESFVALDIPHLEESA